MPPISGIAILKLSIAVTTLGEPALTEEPSVPHVTGTTAHTLEMEGETDNITELQLDELGLLQTDIEILQGCSGKMSWLNEL